MNSSLISCEDFLLAAKEFASKSLELRDGWQLFENKNELYKSYIKKETFIEHEEGRDTTLMRAEYLIFYNLSYGVPSFCFNIWNSTGAFLSLEDIRNMTLTEINARDFYSVVTQQEHPVLQRPYFIVHPCHTEALLAAFRNNTKNIIVTFLGLITPLIKIDLPLEYGL